MPRIGLAAIALAAVATSAAAQDWPTRNIAKLNKATAGAMDTPAVQERLRELGAIVVPAQRRAPDYLARHVESEIRKWAAVIKAAGVTPQ